VLGSPDEIETRLAHCVDRAFEVRLLLLPQPRPKEVGNEESCAAVAHPLVALRGGAPRPGSYVVPFHPLFVVLVTTKDMERGGRQKVGRREGGTDENHHHRPTGEDLKWGSLSSGSEGCASTLYRQPPVAGVLAQTFRDAMNRVVVVAGSRQIAMLDSAPPEPAVLVPGVMGPVGGFVVAGAVHAFR
jgi:hypothetical protein